VSGVVRMARRCTTRDSMKGSSGSGRGRPGVEAHVEHRRLVGRTRPQGPAGSEALAGGGDAQGLEQRAVGHVAGVAVEIVETPVAGVVAVHDEVVVAGDLEAPGLGVVATGAQRARSRILSRVSRLAMVASPEGFSGASRATGGAR
jgi:hypothetical protein